MMVKVQQQQNILPQLLPIPEYFTILNHYLPSKADTS